MRKAYLVRAQKWWTIALIQVMFITALRATLRGEPNRSYFIFRVISTSSTWLKYFDAKWVPSLTPSEFMPCLITQKYNSFVASLLRLWTGLHLASSQHTRAQTQYQALATSDSHIIVVYKPPKLATTCISHHQLCGGQIKPIFTMSPHPKVPGGITSQPGPLAPRVNPLSFILTM